LFKGEHHELERAGCNLSLSDRSSDSTGIDGKEYCETGIEPKISGLTQKDVFEQEYFFN